MVKWIGKFSVLLKRLKDSWMDILSISTLSEEQRQKQYLADVAEEDADRQTRSVELWIRTHKRLETHGMLHR